MQDKDEVDKEEGDSDELDNIAGAEGGEDKGGFPSRADCDTLTAHAHVGEKLIDSNHADDAAIDTNHGNEGIVFNHDVIEVGAGLVDEVSGVGIGKIGEFRGVSFYDGFNDRGLLGDSFYNGFQDGGVDVAFGGEDNWRNIGRRRGEKFDESLALRRKPRALKKEVAGDFVVSEELFSFGFRNILDSEKSIFGGLIAQSFKSFAEDFVVSPGVIVDDGDID